MGRKEQRIQKKLEKNPIRELNKIQNRYYSQLFWKFAQTKDPRHPSYITYTNRMMLGTLYYKGIAGIDSMQEMTEQFNEETVSKNLSERTKLVPGLCYVFYVEVYPVHDL